MVDGQLNKFKIGAIIQGRIKSTRLPGKILFPLPYGSDIPLIVWPINSLKKSKLIDTIVLATSENIENLPLNQIAIDNDISYFAGSENNVLSRFIQASIFEKIDTIVRITGDNPIIDEKLIDQLLQMHLDGEFDYTFSKGLPLGMNIEVIQTEKLQEISKENDLIEADLEHVTHYFKRKKGYKILEHDYKFQSIMDLRLTIDYPSDYALFNILSQEAIFNNLSGIELIHFLNNSKPWIFEINKHINQKKLFVSLEEELEFSLDLLKNHDLNHTIDLLKNKIKNLWIKS